MGVRTEVPRCVRDCIEEGFGGRKTRATTIKLIAAELNSTIRLGDGTACSEGRLNINKILGKVKQGSKLISIEYLRIQSTNRAR